MPSDEISRREFLKQMTCGSLAILALPKLSLLAEDSSPSQAPPNILFIFTDDHAVQAISAYGS